MSQNQKDREPTKEEVIAWYKEQIELAKLRHELAELQSKAVQEEAKRLQAMAIIAQFKTPLNSNEDDAESENAH